MANKKQRVLAWIGASIFLFSTLAFSGLIVFSINKQRKANQEATSLDGQQEEEQLQGTKLEDFTALEKVEQLQAVDLKVGDGEEVKPGASVTAHYTGAVAATGVIFQSSHDGPNQPVPFSLDGVIAGWTQGVPGMKVGGTRRLLIPAALAYGANPPAGSGIPVNADLVFDIELIGVDN